MCFAERLKELRKERHLSQEELAELLDVSRQAVSKWEQGDGYPEVQKLLLLAERLNISLDSLMTAEASKKEGAANPPITGTITITSPTENVIATCCKVMSSGRMKGGKTSPQYALFGVSRGGTLGRESTTFLGWYANREEISKEILDIQRAMERGIPAYTLKYSANVERRLLSVRMIDP